MDHSSGDFGTLKTNGWCLSFFFCYKEGGRIRRLSGTVRRLFIPAKVFRFGTINGAGLILRLSHDAPESNERAY